MRKHKIFIFAGTNGTWRGDCPKWAESMRTIQPALIETRGVGYGPRWSCTPCREGWVH